MKKRLQTFVSSTYTDLVSERQAAVSAILKAGHIPAGMELFTAGDKSQMVIIKQWIDESDVYMLILGGRYGSIEPSSGMSYTELEYDYAVQQGKPLFAVVIQEDALERKIKSGGSAYIERENPKDLALFRTKVLGNMSSFFADEKDIKLAVHESLADFATNRELQGWVSASEVVDTKPLFDEIAKLSEENRQLKESLQLQQSAASNKSKEAVPYDDLFKILKATEVKIPAAVNRGTESESDLVSIFYTYKEALVVGITNENGAGPVTAFLFNNICTKLEVHGLTATERITGVQYRRYRVTPLGNKFLAYIDRKVLVDKEFEFADRKKPAAETATSLPRKPAPLAVKSTTPKK